MYVHVCVYIYILYTYLKMVLYVVVVHVQHCVQRPQKYGVRMM
jgi:hypothetical protein